MTRVFWRGVKGSEYQCKRTKEKHHLDKKVFLKASKNKMQLSFPFFLIYFHSIHLVYVDHPVDSDAAH